MLEPGIQQITTKNNTKFLLDQRLHKMCCNITLYIYYFIVHEV